MEIICWNGQIICNLFQNAADCWNAWVGFLTISFTYSVCSFLAHPFVFAISFLSLSHTHTVGADGYLNVGSSVRWLLHCSREGYVHLFNCLLKLTHSVRLYLTWEVVWECRIVVPRALMSRLWEVWFNFILSIAQPLPNRKMHPIYTIMKNEGTAEHSKANAFWFLFSLRDVFSCY